MIRALFLSVLGAVLFAGTLLFAQTQDAPRLRGPEPFSREIAAPPLLQALANDVRRRRNYPDQPPLIPHSIEGYALDLNANKCLSCHSRKFTEQSQAPMISVTHYQDRDGNTLASIAPRRYVCTSCHVTQTGAPPLVENRFVDVDELMEPDPKGRK